VSSPRTGRGIRVAVLDTGVDLAHPDLAGRAVTATSFVPGQSAQDGHGHGTHCVGTACGPRTVAGSRGYGVAPEAEVLVGKVLSDEGSGTDAEILAGIAWAVRNGCQVISMSLGADTPEPSPAYTAAGRRALDQGSLIVAAAGNNADRGSGEIGFVGAPANSPDVLAVGALDALLEVASFSARSTALPGGQVDLAAPGVDVYSSWPVPTCYDTISGTSMATPHVAGLAALWAEETGLRGRDLWWALDRASRRLPLPSVDVGSGLPRAPQ
jgi:subtilisin family serine protease